LRDPHPCEVGVITKDYFIEAAARRIHLDAERVERVQAVTDDLGHVGWGVTSGLGRREDA